MAFDLITPSGVFGEGGFDYSSPQGSSAPLAESFISKPDTVPNGTVQALIITGTNTVFDATTTASISGTLVDVNAVTYYSPTHIVLYITVHVAVTLGMRDITITTGSDVVSLFNGLTIVQRAGGGLPPAPTSKKKPQPKVKAPPTVKETIMMAMKKANRKRRRELRRGTRR